MGTVRRSMVAWPPPSPEAPAPGGPGARDLLRSAKALLREERSAMKPPLRVPLAALVVLAAAAGALLLLVPLLSQQSYSRSRSIAEGMRRGLRFSGGILAGARTPELAELLRSQALAQPRRGRGGRGAPPGLPDTRVSNDILPPDGASAGEPKTEAEPYLAADPEDPNRLVAFYQEDRFPSVGGARALTFALSTDGGRHWRGRAAAHPAPGSRG